MGKVATAKSLLKLAKKCTSGCPDLDSFLRGGFPCGSVTELVGESASAKTQLCLQLSLAVQLPVSEGGLNGSALYVYTENYFPYRRLQEIANHMVSSRARQGRELTSNVRSLRSLDVNKLTSHKLFTPVKPARKLEAVRSTSTTCEGAENPCNRVFVQAIQTVENLLEYLEYAYSLLRHPFLMPVRVIVIDSIAALFRSDFDNTSDEMKERSSFYFQVATKLKKYAEEFNLAVVVTNQVKDWFAESESLPNKSAFGMRSSHDCEVLVTSGRRVAPSLALSWTHCVNTRLFLSRSNCGDGGMRRSMQVVFAPHLPIESCDFEVNSMGVQVGYPTPLQEVSTHSVRGTTPGNFLQYKDEASISSCDEGDILVVMSQSGRIVSSPPGKIEYAPISTPDTFDRVFELSQSQRVAGTPPSMSKKRKNEFDNPTACDKKTNLSQQLKHFR